MLGFVLALVIVQALLYLTSLGELTSSELLRQLVTFHIFPTSVFHDVFEHFRSSLCFVFV